MEILHTSDWHLGRMIHGKSLLEDQTYFIDQCFFPILEQERPDCVILAGDVFDRRIAPVEAIRLFDRVMERMSQEYGIPLLVVAGNHDSADRLTMGASLLRKQGVYLAGRLEDASNPIILRDDEGEVHFYLIPYVDTAAAKTADASVHTSQDVYRTLVKKISRNTNTRRVMVGHLFAAGASPSASESVFLGGTGQVSAALFQDFDYVALGHLHTAQKAGENGWYSGSPLPYSFEEGIREKSLRLITLSANKKTVVRELPIKPLRHMRVLRGTFEELLELGKRKREEDYLLIELTDTFPILEPMARLREVYPNLLCLRSEWMNQTKFEQEERRKLRQGLQDEKIGDLVVFDAFLQQICGEKPSEEDHRIFRQAQQVAESEEMEI